MGCCSNKAAAVEEELVDVLKSVEQVFPGTHYALVVTRTGDVRCFTYTTPDHMHTTEAIAALRLAVLQFVNTFGMRKCPVLHVNGVNNIFSCYDVGSDVLAFNSRIGNVEFDVDAADAAMAPVLERLRHLLERQAALAK